MSLTLFTVFSFVCSLYHFDHASIGLLYFESFTLTGILVRQEEVLLVVQWHQLHAVLPVIRNIIVQAALQHPLVSHQLLDIMPATQTRR